MENKTTFNPFTCFDFHNGSYAEFNKDEQTLEIRKMETGELLGWYHLTDSADESWDWDIESGWEHRDRHCGAPIEKEWPMAEAGFNLADFICSILSGWSKKN